MHILKKIFTATTGYWIHKLSNLPIGADLYLDIHNRIKYGSLTTVFDVGANNGQTWEWVRYNERESKIHCFEPVKATFDSLKTKVKNDKNCIVENMAFGNAPGVKEVRLFESNLSALNSLKDDLMNGDLNAAVETIQIDTIENYCLRKNISHIDLLKIDTKGYELDVLEGALELLDAGCVSFIYCEVGFLKKNVRNTNFSDVAEWLAQRSYFFYGLYQLVNNNWKEGDHFGNALFVYKNLI